MKRIALYLLLGLLVPLPGLLLYVPGLAYAGWRPAGQPFSTFAALTVTGSEQFTGLCAPPTIATGTYTDFVPNCPQWTNNKLVTTLDLDLTSGDVHLNCLDGGKPGQLLFLVNEGSSNLYINSQGAGCVNSSPFVIPNFHTAYTILTESSVAILRYGPDRYGDNDWQLIAQSNNAMTSLRDIAAAGDTPTLTGCGTSPQVIVAGIYSGLIKPGTSATGCTVTMHGLASGTLNCVVSPETFPTTFTYTSEASNNTLTLTGSGVAGIKFHYFCDLVGN